ncbi:hypothetical protein Scep_026230 [Stephania cephalantha]|uniref:Uncharacterized protein n=1 Tax=Stephania cephalantha TaxID=152367 RepID=A0AAP0EJR0_9MAGN
MFSKIMTSLSFQIRILQTKPFRKAKRETNNNCTDGGFRYLDHFMPKSALKCRTKIET